MDMMRFKIFNSSLKFCTSIHLVLFFAAIIWFMPPGSVAGVIDQLDEILEFIFSTVPLKNFYMLNDLTANMNAARLIAIFFVTVLPGYVIGYLLFLRFFKKQIQ